MDDYKKFVDEIQMVLFGKKEKVIDNFLLEKIIDKIKNLKNSSENRWKY